MPGRPGLIWVEPILIEQRAAGNRGFEWRAFAGACVLSVHVSPPIHGGVGKRVKFASQGAEAAHRREHQHAPRQMKAARETLDERCGAVAIREAMPGSPNPDAEQKQPLLGEVAKGFSSEVSADHLRLRRQPLNQRGQFGRSQSMRQQRV